MSSHPELELFNGLHGLLEIELTEPPQQVAPHMLNLKASPTAKIASLRFEVTIDDGGDEPRPLNQAELDSIAFAEPRIRLTGETSDTVAIEAPNGRHFTVRDLIQAIETAELELRAKSEWDGGIDVHHIYFEGLSEEPDGAFFISWGS